MCRAQAAWVVYEFEKSSRGGLGRNRLFNPGVAFFTFDLSIVVLVIVTIVIIVALVVIIVALVVIVVIVAIATIVALVIIVVKAPWPLRGPWGFLRQNLQFASKSW